MQNTRKPDRARQFMPFASLRGYYDLIRQQERVREPRRELSDDQAEELSAALAEFRRGDMVRVRHYAGDHYELTEGVLTGFDATFRKMTIVHTEIRFDDIISAERLPFRDDMADI